MANEKMTYGKAVAYVLENCEIPAEVKEKLEGLAGSLAKKNGTAKKPTKTQVENEGYKESILAFLRVNPEQGFTCDNLRKAVGELNEFSNQKVSALMSQLVEAKAVEKYADKRRTYFKIAG